MRVERKWVMVNLDALLIGIDVAAHAVLGTCPGVDVIAGGWAQIVMEHGRAAGVLRGLFNHNYGNRDATPAELADPDVPWFRTTGEREVRRDGTEYRAIHMRRAYPDMDTGLRAWLEDMRDRWDALDVMHDPIRLARRLKEKGHYTGHESEYAAGLVSLAREGARMWSLGR